MKRATLLLTWFLPWSLWAQSPQTEELTDTKPHDSETVWTQQAARPQLRWGSTDIRYAKKSVPTGLSKTQKATAWRGERVHLQAVLYSANSIQSVTLHPGALKSGKQVIPAENVSAAFVRYVMTDELNKNGKGGCGHRPDASKFDSSLVADRVDACRSLSIEACSTRPLWLSVRIPRDAQPGTYRGTLTVRGENMQTLSLPYEVTVKNRTLPLPSDWKFHLDLWQNPYAVARFYNVPLWSKEHFDLMRPLMEHLAQAGQKVITATIMNRPWNGQTEDAFPSMVLKQKNIDGSWSYDYTVFDRWVEFMMSTGIQGQINCYTLVPWALTFDYFDQATNCVQYVHAQPGEPAYAAYWSTFLKDFARHLKQKGWFSRTTIAMDERPMNHMREALKVIFQADKDFKVSGAIKYFPEIEPQIHDLCLAYGEELPQEVLQRRQSEGKVSTFYTCCTEAYPNTFSFSAPAEAAWLPWHAMALGCNGYLRWAYNSWTKNPLQDTRFRTWAAGDCFLVYPGATSIRMLRLTEGIQDAEKIRILREEFTRKGQTAQLKRLNELVGEFIPENLHGPNATEMVNRAHAALNRF